MTDLSEFFISEWSEGKAIVVKKNCDSSIVEFQLEFNREDSNYSEDFDNIANSESMNAPVGVVTLIHLNKVEALRFAKRLISCLEAVDNERISSSDSE